MSVAETFDPNTIKLSPRAVDKVRDLVLEVERIFEDQAQASL